VHHDGSKPASWSRLIFTLEVTSRLGQETESGQCRSKVFGGEIHDGIGVRVALRGVGLECFDGWQVDSFLPLLFEVRAGPGQTSSSSACLTSGFAS
jgi:hypothetical protein